MSAVVSDPTPVSVDERIVAALLPHGKLEEPDLVRARRLQEQDGGSLLALPGPTGLGV